MKRAMLWAGAVVLAVTVSACAHTDDPMLSGAHSMTGPAKATTMSNEVMPSRNPNCTEEALAKMPPEHRQACFGNNPPPPTQR